MSDHIREYAPAGILDLTFHPNWDYIEITRLYLEDFLVFNLPGSEQIQRVSVAASELLENAVKHSNGSSVRMILEKSGEGDEIVLSVFNSADWSIASGLLDRIEVMNRIDSLDYYVFRMKESVTCEPGNSRLGLARIYHECRARLSTFFDPDEGKIEVRATMHL